MASIVTRYATRLRDVHLQHRTLEETIEQLRMATNAAWVAAFEKLLALKSARPDR